VSPGAGSSWELLLADRLDPAELSELAQRRPREAWLLLAVRELAVGPSRSGVRRRESWSELLGGDFAFAFALAPQDALDVLRHLPHLVPEIAAYEPGLLLLPRYAPPPSKGSDKDKKLRSFGCSPQWLRELAELGAQESTSELCYEACRLAFDAPSLAPRVLARQVPPATFWRSLAARRRRALRFADAPASGGVRPAGSARVIVPHAGDLSELARLLGLLEGLVRPPVVVSVGFDEPISEAHRALVRRFPDFSFHSVEPAGAGPYVVRHFLGSEAKEDFLIFQDSDDVPCLDRIPLLTRAMTETDYDLLGSHEVRIDDRFRSAYRVRFPVDVNRALRRSTKHPQLHPTTVVRSAAFQAAGGLSTSRRFASDREFLLRGYFSMRIGNLSDYLYLRRKREGSLTTSGETGMHSPVRRELRKRWNLEFKAVRRGKLPLAESVLCVNHSETEFAFVDLRSGARRRKRFA
jgi:hypothetical protein